MRGKGRGAGRGRGGTCFSRSVDASVSRACSVTEAECTGRKVDLQRLAGLREEKYTQEQRMPMELEIDRPVLSAAGERELLSRRSGPSGRILSGLIRVAESLLVFLFVANLAVLGMFLLGNFQSFADETLYLLLNLLRVSSLASLIISGYYVVLLVVYMARTKRLRLVRFLLGVFFAAFSGALAVGIELLRAVLLPQA